MYLIPTHTQPHGPSYELFFSDRRRNWVMDGLFSKLYFSNAFGTFTTFLCPMRSIAEMETLEKDILTTYASVFGVTKPWRCTLAVCRGEDDTKEKEKDKNKKKPNYVVKLSGVWETDYEIGLNCKCLVM